MANTKPVVDSVEILSDLVERAKKEAIRVRFSGAVSKDLKGKEMTDFEAMANAGAYGITDDGIPLMDELFVVDAMENAKKLQLPLSFHEEDPAFIVKAGTHKTAPAVAEDVLVARDAMLALSTMAPVNIQHISSGNSVALVRTAKTLGANIHAEATPHHFSLTEDAVELHGTYAKMNPPLRTEKDRLAIIDGLKDNTIDIIATDHAPHSTEEKHKEDFFSCPSGIIGLETSLALGVTNLVRPGHLSMVQLLQKMTSNPAKLYHIDADAVQKPLEARLADPLETGDNVYGAIRKGSIADLVIFAPDETFIAGNYKSKSENTPFTGCELYGKIHYTICDGKIVYQA